MKVIDWISYDEAEGKTESVGGMGGWFGRRGDKWDAPHRWADYLNGMDAEQVAYVEAIRDSVLATGRFFTGQQHQDGDGGVPLFEDGTVGIFSFRGWGDLMVAIATVKDGKNHNYMEFYC